MNKRHWIYVLFVLIFSVSVMADVATINMNDDGINYIDGHIDSGIAGHWGFFYWEILQ